MKHCFLCSGDFTDDTRMVMARGGSEICLPCAATERGQRLTAHPEDANRRAYRVGDDRRDGLRKALFYWQHGYRQPRRKD